jgi:RNA polymerase sigma-70 factor (ECF subfamily)
MLMVRERLVATPAEHDFDRLFRDEAPGVWRTMLAFTGGRSDVAEDAVSEAFARAFARRGRIRDPIAWVYRVAFRLAAEELRHDRRRAAPVEAETAEPELVGVFAALRQLSPNQRAAVVMRYVADLDVNEVARRMGVAAPTVRVHLHRARTRLRTLLAEEEPR